MNFFVCAELKTAKSDRDIDAMKTQSESLSKEYDRVSSELQRLQVRSVQLFGSFCLIFLFLQKLGDDDSKKEQ